MYFENVEKPQTIVIIAVTRADAEYMYKMATAHKVSKAGAQAIADALTKARYGLQGEDEKWRVYEIDKYTGAWDYANGQAFTRRAGSISRRAAWPFSRKVL